LDKTRLHLIEAQDAQNVEVPTLISKTIFGVATIAIKNGSLALTKVVICYDLVETELSAWFIV